MGLRSEVDIDASGKKASVVSFKVYLIFALSGATALIYQIIWARWLGLVFGNTTTSVSIVLGSFMLGLAAGSWAAGRLLHRVRNPMKAYAFMELGIGLFALCFPFVSEFVDLVFVAFVDEGSSVGYSLFVRALLAFFLLMIPTSLMGATLPFLTDFFRRSPRHSMGWKAGVLYAANTFGAALGIVAASFILIELLGVRVTELTAACLNFMVAYIGLRFSRASGPLESEARPADEGKFDSMRKFAVWVLAASGALALASEVLWTRTLETLLGNSTYAFATIVLLYLLGIAAGSWIMSLVVGRLRALHLWLAALLLYMGVWTVASIYLFFNIIEGVVQYSDSMVSLSVMLLSYVKTVSLLLPLSLLSGACFPVATRILDPEARDARGASVARAYAWNTLGAVAGSLAAGFLIAPHFDYFQALYLLAALYCMASLVAFVFVGRLAFNVPNLRAAAASLGALSLAVAAFSIAETRGESSFVRNFNTTYPLNVVAYHEPGLQGVTSAIRERGEPLAYILIVNGKGMTTKITDTKMMAHLPMLLHPGPENTLVICFGMGTTYRSAISYGGRVTAVELVEEVFEAFDFFYHDSGRVRAYPGGRMVVNDGRNYLKLSGEKYDVITVDPPPPIDAAGVTHLYSREFLELARSRLNEKGIMAHWIPLPGTRSGVDDFETVMMLMNTFTEVFPYSYLIKSLNGMGLHLLGSLEPISFSPELFKERISEKMIKRDLEEWDPVPISFFRNLVMYKPSDNIRVLTDDRPMLEFYLFRTLKSGGKKSYAHTYW
jgi:spermidine synthase